MREIKFRAWDKKNKRMDSVWEISFAGKPPEANEAQVGDLLLGIDTQCVLMQFTGLKDKNGKEVYEGDILRGEFGKQSELPLNKIFGKVKWHYGKYKIEFDSVYRTLDLSQIDGNHAIYWRQENNRCEDDYYRIENIEVIGNIYENPELLTPNH